MLSYWVSFPLRSGVQGACPLPGAGQRPARRSVRVGERGRSAEDTLFVLCAEVEAAPRAARGGSERARGEGGPAFGPPCTRSRELESVGNSMGIHDWVYETPQVHFGLRANASTILSRWGISQKLRYNASEQE